MFTNILNAFFPLIATLVNVYEHKPGKHTFKKNKKTQ